MNAPGVILEDVTVTTTENHWARYQRWGPPALLATGAFLSVGSASLLMSRGEQYTAAVLTVVAVGWELWRWHRRRFMPEQDSVYYLVRSALAFALSWLNPFFAVYAAAGYFDAHAMLPERWIRLGLLVTAVTLAGSQAGGLPPQNRTMWIAFGLLVVLNGSISIVMMRIAERDEQRSRERLAVIEELERTNVRLERALSENQALHAQLLVRAREAGIDDERRRLAAEIHDTLAQGLAGIVTQLQAAQDTVDDGAAHRHVESAIALARRSLGDARRSVRNLAPEVLEHDGLDSALAHTVAAWSRDIGVGAEFTVTGTPVPLPDDVEATLLRIVQEALTNVGKHAGAQRVGVTMSYMDGEVSVDIRDDGCGFTVTAPVCGFGLRGMRSRVGRVGGTLIVESAPGEGTAVSARIPSPTTDRIGEDVS